MAKKRGREKRKEKQSDERAKRNAPKEWRDMEARASHVGHSSCTAGMGRGERGEGEGGTPERERERGRGCGGSDGQLAYRIYDAL